MSFLLLLLAACSESKESFGDIIEDELYLRVYSDSLFTREVTETDTFTIDILSTLKLYVEASSGNNLTVAYDKRDIAVECTQEGEYLCTPMSRGTKKIVFLGAEVIYVYFKVKGIEDTYVVTEDTYTVETPSSEEVRDEILGMLPECTSPQEGNLLVLYYETLQSGTFDYLPSGTTGLFTVSAEADYKLSGEGVEMNFALQELENESSSYETYLIVQDLTGAFRLKYPQEKIDTVTVVSKAEKISRSYY